ncbi:hypothetical protein K0M31_018301 [Melipona bicolor]|uniref:Uncharacterized protein n=1 Tax=Melipona bicolor TaxID=60889 RepID=A0AA40G367_9HYME|nr:hypothetical protein K0M31_018301 [Melipona bicolor]
MSKKSQKRSSRRHKNMRKVELGDIIKTEKEQRNKVGIEFSWEDLCQYIPKCVLQHVDKLRQTAVKRLGLECSEEFVDQFLIFTFEQLINENKLTVDKFITLEERTENLAFSDAQTMFDIIVTIREKFNENPIRPVNNITKECNFFGLKFEYKSRVSDSVKLDIMPAKNITQIVGNSLLKCKNKEMPLKIGIR